jgi:hypothetical protein
VATEDTYAPKQYFGFFQNPRLHVQVLETAIGTAQDPRAVVNRLISFAEQYQIAGDDQLWVLLDTDHWIQERHKGGLIQAIEDARRRGYYVAMSRPCFDLWLLLHHEPVAPDTAFALCADVGARIRQVVGEFNKTNLKQEHYPVAKVTAAIARARTLDTAGPRTPPEFWPETTSTRVYLLLEQLQAAGFLSPPA